MPHFLFASILSTVLVLYTKKKKSLSSDGRWGAFVLGMVTFSSSMYVFGVVLLSFFLSSSKLTKFKADKKRLLEEDYETSSERNLTQVLCNGLMGGLIVGAFQMLEPLQCYQQVPWGTILLWAYIGHYGCCAGDTWASELGILNKEWPILITRLKKVPPGTNGGVSRLGLLASLAGGGFIGLTAAISLWFEQECGGFGWDVLIVGLLSGLVGSLVDSILGATVQQSLYSEDKKMIVTQDDAHGTVISGISLLDNHQVNFVSSALTSGLCALSAWYFYSV